jgi:hypothetical protein
MVQNYYNTFNFNKVSKLNTFDKSFFYKNENILKKKINNFHNNNNVSPFNYDISTENNQSKIINNKNLAPIVSTNPFINKFDSNLNSNKINNSPNQVFNDNLNMHLSSF